MPETTGETSSTPVAYRGPVRAKPSLGRRFATNARLWARHTLSRESLISSFKTFLWVVPLTVMIWIYAEREQLATLSNVPIKIEPLNSDPNRIITFADATGRTIAISADLAGPRGRLERAQRQLETSLALKLDIGSNADSGVRRVYTRSLSDDPLFKDNGITVRNIVPEEVTVRIDPVETRELAVQPPADNSNRLVSFNADPRTVKVSGPQSFFRDHPNVGVRADVALDMPGRHEEKVTLNLNLPALTPARFVSITPSTVTAKYEVRQADLRYTIHAMTVWVTYSQGVEWNKFMADCPTAISDVTVIGPEEIINRLKKNDPTLLPTPHAEFEVESGTPAPDPSHPDQPSTAPLHYVLPEGLRVDNEAASRTITFKLKARPTE
jgi:hypothetical protein